MNGKISKNLIVIAIIIAGVLIAGAIFYINQEKGEKISGFLTAQQAAEKTINFINQYLVEQGMVVSLLNAGEEHGLYKISFKAGEEEYDSYVTRDGKLLFFQGIDLEQKLPFSQAGNETTKDIPKRDRPDVKLFVMSYCPYGLQMEKAFLPVYDLLKEKADMGVYFVNYIMHGKQEIDENLRQYCIQKKEKEKFYNYLNCFVQEENSDKCLSDANIDKNKMNSCISETDQKYKITELYNDKNTWLNGNYPRFDVHTDLNEKYGVQGSPTLVINDVVVNIERLPEKIKEAICQAFNSPPEECSQTLSYIEDGSSSGGSCQ